MKEELDKAKAEIERLTERLDYFQKSSDYHEGNQKELEAKNAELQKQVDELKEQKAFWEGMHDRVCSELEELKEEKSNTDLVTQIYVLKNKLEQAVKDTANECYELFKFYKKHYYDIPLDLVARDIKEKTGVEVE